MSRYIVNPKTDGSGILACIPQRGVCPNGCADCFFQSGRSYLEPLDDNLPNMPPVELAERRVVRVNDGNDSNVNREQVISATEQYPFRFFNTAIPKDIDSFPGPVVLTVNPGEMTDTGWHKVEPVPPNLMFVRFRANTWNLHKLKQVIQYYTGHGVPVVLTFMAYFDEAGMIRDGYKADYMFRERTTNSYWAITTEAWEHVMRTVRKWGGKKGRYNPLVHSCGKVEGEKGSTSCKHCGNCIREFFVTLERMEHGQ